MIDQQEDEGEATDLYSYTFDAKAEDNDQQPL